MPVHHLVEHGLDLLIAVCVLSAVYRSGSSGSIGPDDALESDLGIEKR